MASPVVVSRIQNRRGTQAQFNALYPAGYGGIGGYGSVPGFTPAAYPDVLQAGELGLITDTRRIIIGNLNGEFIGIAEASTEGLQLQPIVVQLPPSPVFAIVPTPVPGLAYTATPFNTIVYDITDSLSPDWDSIGTNFSRNGELRVTAVADFAPIPNPPFPPLIPVTLVDTGTEINKLMPSSITFEARYDITASHIEIFYMHDFAGSLTFSTSTIKWLPF